MNCGKAAVAHPADNATANAIPILHFDKVINFDSKFQRAES